jgi:hypothetical protein
MHGDPMPITLADVDDRIRRALAAERKHQQRLLKDFADQLRNDLEKIVLSLTAEIASLVVCSPSFAPAKVNRSPRRRRRVRQRIN